MPREEAGIQEGPGIAFPFLLCESDLQYRTVADMDLPEVRQRILIQAVDHGMDGSSVGDHKNRPRFRTSSHIVEKTADAADHILEGLSPFRRAVPVRMVVKGIGDLRIHLVLSNHFQNAKAHLDDSGVHLKGTALSSGGKLRVNRTAVEADLLIAEGFIEPHFFAGFSGGRKSVLPGICSAETVVANHCAAFIDSPRARTGVLEDNPIHRDMLWAAQTAGLAFVLNVAIDAQKRVIGAWAGEPDAAHRVGCAFVDARAGVDAAPADIVITTNGGHPLDQNIYQAVKGMTAAEATCKPGGVIVICAAAGDGHGGQSFYDTFASGEPLESILARFRATPAEQTIPDQWQSQIFIRVLQQFHVVMVTEAPREMVEALRMHKAESLEEALTLADELLGRSDGSITVVPDGVSVIVRQ